ncbi:MAG: YbjN domain-containing protein [Paracoccaceae bacterium]
MRILALFIAAIAVFSAPALAQNITSTNPEGMVEALANLGQNPELGTDQVGDPLIAAEGESGPYTIWFYNCTNGTACSATIFSAGYDLPDGADIEMINAWNSGKLMGRAYLDDENDPFLDQYLVLGGGMALLTFAQFVNEWDRALGEFRAEIDF